MNERRRTISRSLSRVWTVLRGMLAEIGNITTVQQMTVNSRFPSCVPSPSVTGNCIFQGIRYLPGDILQTFQSNTSSSHLCIYRTPIFAKRSFQFQSSKRIEWNQTYVCVVRTFRHCGTRISMHFLNKFQITNSPDDPGYFKWSEL